MNTSDVQDFFYLVLDSNPAEVSPCLARVAQFIRRDGNYGAYAVLLVVRELLMNAIMHGNKECSLLRVQLRITRRGRLFEVQVDDEGEGFDFEALDLSLPEDPLSLEGRGLVLVKALSEKLVFERGGSRVKAVVYPDARHSELGREGRGPAESKERREATCTSPMAKSL